MADLALVTAAKVTVVKSIIQTDGLVAAETIVAGAPVRLDTNGKLTNARGNIDAESAAVGIAAHSAIANQGLTALCVGLLDGFDLSGMAYGDPVYLSTNDGRLATTPGASAMRVGRVFPATGVPIGTAYDKILRVELLGMQSNPAIS